MKRTGSPALRLAAPLSRDKQDTLLLIASTLLVLLPHASHLPLWVSLVCGATLAWRAALTMLGRRMPDLDLVTPEGPVRIFALLRNARPVLLNLATPGSFDIAPWSDRVKLVDAKYGGPWELPALGLVAAPTAVLIRPDGYVAWVGDGTQDGLQGAMNTWFGPPTDKLVSS